MISVQWLIDFLRTIQDQRPASQIGLVVVIVVSVILIIVFVKRMFRRGYQDIKDENDRLMVHIETTEKTLNKIRQKNAALQREIETMQARLPEAALSIVNLETRDGNHERAYRELQRMFDDLAPDLRDCFLRLSELAGTPGEDGAECDNVADIERYKRLSDLLQTVEKEAKPS